MTTPFSLLDEAWLSVHTASGERLFIRPADIVQVREDPIVRFDWSRPELDAASIEFMIGLLSTACWSRVRDIEIWTAWWQSPPSPTDLDAAFAPLSHVFWLDGDGARFMQDLEELDGTKFSVESLLIGTPGEQTRKLNRDLFVKRDQVATLSRATSAVALFALQAFAPSGGAGHRTSLRGGGPMSTLVLPVASDSEKPITLWQRLWLNTYWDESWGDPLASINKVFPWCEPTRTSDEEVMTTPKDVHPGQVYWGMPRRIRLNDAIRDNRQTCDVLGIFDGVTLRNFVMVTYGHNYEGWSRAHPLTPYYRSKPTAAEWLPSLTQPGHIGYRDWAGLVVADAADHAESKRQPALIVEIAKERLRELNWSARVRLRVAGFDMDKMKARGFVESEMPLSLLPPEIQEIVDRAMRLMIAGANVAASLLSRAIGQTLSDNEMPDASKGLCALANERFWAETEGDFLRILDGLAQAFDGADHDTASNQVADRWLIDLRKACFNIFDDLVPLSDIEEHPIERLVKARRRLQNALLGYGKGGLLFKALGLPPPESKPKKRRKAK